MKPDQVCPDCESDDPDEKGPRLGWRCGCGWARMHIIDCGTQPPPCDNEWHERKI